MPNVLSLGRIILSPALGYFVLSENYKLALTFFAIAGVSDLVGRFIMLYSVRERIKKSFCLFYLLPIGRRLHC